MTALLNGGFNFQKFTLSPEYKLTYIWGRNRQPFDEEDVKNKIKDILAAAVDMAEGAPAE
jgi:hypothetical protein